MAKFRVALIRIETQTFTIEAENSADAVDKISDAWDNGELELDNPELCDTDFFLIGRADI